MPVKLNEKWFLDAAADHESRVWLNKIFRWREQVLKTNRFIEDETPFWVRLGEHSIMFQPSSCYSTIEVVQEIFCNRCHFQVPEFEGAGASCIVDVGANQGHYILKLREFNKHCRIIAVEPNTLESGVLKENLKANSIQQVTIEECAIAPESGELEMEIIPQIGAIGAMKVRTPERPWIKDSFVRRLRVPAITLDQLFEKNHISKADILKMDVEGMEYDILKGTSVFPRIEKLVLEYHGLEIKTEVALVV